MDMQEDIIASFDYGKAALKKLAPVPENFRLYLLEWLGERPGERTILKITGAEFRKAKTGKNKGKLTVMVENSKRTVYLTKEEILDVDKTKEINMILNKQEIIRKIRHGFSLDGWKVGSTVDSNCFSINEFVENQNLIFEILKELADKGFIFKDGDAHRLTELGAIKQLGWVL